MISSKELIDLTGISRATLNNYIAMGLLPRPLISTPGEDEESRARQLGYFPDTAAERIAEIQRLKREGYTMAQIVTRLAPEGPRADAANVTPRDSGPLPGATALAEPPRLTVEGIGQPAFMVNYNFEVIWFNRPAQTLFLGPESQLPATSDGRNLFRLLLTHAAPEGNQRALLRFHLSLAKERITKTTLLSLCHGVPPDRLALLEKMYAEIDPEEARPILDAPIHLDQPDGSASSHRMYAAYFREGILLILMPEGVESEGLLHFLARRDEVIRSLLRKRLPVLTDLAVLVADLQNSVKICSELPPEEYFELINEICSVMSPIFRKYFGTHGKHAGDGLLYYFFPQPDSNYIFNALRCAREIRSEMQKISKAWQIRKNWLNELYLNIGLTEGQEWLGTFQSATSVEFIVLGDSINQASRISDFARFGAIWATKSFMGKLSTEERLKVRFGVTRSTPEGREVFVSSSYATVSALVSLESARNDKLRDIATLPVTEVVEVAL
ncbi:MAG: adenylate/guanylate cyclase domain-containing protein [Betaproteobacteria bacterium]